MRDVNRLRILQDVIDRNLRPGLAAEMLGITPRHCSRLLKRYRQSGPLGMNNQSRGRTGNRLLSASLTDQALNIIRERYADFGATLTWDYNHVLTRFSVQGNDMEMMADIIPSS